MSNTITDPGTLRRWLASPALPFWSATLGCLPLLAVHFQQLWSRPHYRYFPVILLLVPVLLHLRRTDPDQVACKPRPLLAGLAMISGLTLAAYSVLKISPLMCCAAWLLTMIAYVVRTPTNIWVLWALMCMLLRLPQGRDVWLIQRLQSSTTRISSGILDQLKIDHIREGTVLLFPDRKLFVEEVSGGVVSPFTIVATTVILSAILRRSLFHTFLLMLSGVFWAAVADILRVVVMSFCVERMGIDLTTGHPNDFLNVALYCVMLALLLSTDSCLRFFLGPIEIDESHASEPVHENPIVRLWNFLFWPLHERPMGLLRERTAQPVRPSGVIWISFALMISVGFLSLGVLQLWGGIGPFGSVSGIRQAVDDLSKESFPPELSGWTLTDFRRESRNTSSEFGERSRQWTYRRGDEVITISIDYPFSEWHKLGENYQQTGWRVDREEPLPDSPTGLQHPLSNSEDAGWLIYDMIDQQGNPYQKPLNQSVDPRWSKMFYENAPRWSPPSFFQIQLLYLAPTLQRPSTETVKELQMFFATFRDGIREKTSSRPPGVSP